MADETVLIPRWRKLLYLLVLLLIVVIVGEFASHVALYIAYGSSVGEDQRMHEYDPDLGWINARTRHVRDKYGGGKHATHNAQGLRASREYSEKPPAGKFRILCFGDSFTYGMCGDDETYPARLQELCPDIQVLNMGCPGYGIGQAYLAYKRDGARFQADMVVFAFIGDDYTRLSRLTFMTQLPKPLLKLRNRELVVTNVPVPTWGTASETGWFSEFPKRMALYQVAYTVLTRLFADPDPFPVAARVFDEFARLCEERGQTLVLVYLPSGYAGSQDLDGGGPSQFVRQVTEHAARRRIAFLDLTDDFKAVPEAEAARLHMPDHHYSPAGNRFLAQTLLKKLRNLVPAMPREGG